MLKPIVYSKPEAAEVLQVSIHTLEEGLFRHERPIPHIRFGRRVIIPRAGLMKWLMEESGASRPPPSVEAQR